MPQTRNNVPEPKPSPSSEPVWTYRGYQLKSSEFTTAMVHLFRAEIQRANVWRQRLDTTTNWAVVTTGAAISFAFTQAQGSHIVILLNILLVTTFLIMEARRYRYYELWASRVRLMETDFYAAMLVPPFHPSPDWAESLAESLLTPHFPISSWEAIGRRLRRNYLWIYAIVGLSWGANLWLMPTPVNDLPHFIERAAIGGLSGQIVLGLVAVYFCLLGILAIFTLNLRQASGEVLPRFDLPHLNLGNPKAWFRHSARRQQLLTFIITNHPEPVAAAILSDMRRGATIVDGKGAYSGQPHSVLMVALTATEISQLKSLVAQVDPQAFVIVSPAQSVYGGGFSPLDDNK
jgi:uncharacterized membrane protein